VFRVLLIIKNLDSKAIHYANSALEPFRYDNVNRKTLKASFGKALDELSVFEKRVPKKLVLAQAEIF
jgi:hypothetical protein